MISFYDGITESQNIALAISPLIEQELTTTFKLILQRPHAWTPASMLNFISPSRSMSRFVWFLIMVSCKQGLTGLLQSPVRGAEKSGLPGMLSGKLFLKRRHKIPFENHIEIATPVNFICLAVYGVSGLVSIESLVHRVLVETFYYRVVLTSIAQIGSVQIANQ